MGAKRVWVAAHIERGNAVLVRLRGAGPHIDGGKYGPPGGGVEPGELIREALIREVYEETRGQIRSAKLVAVYDEPRGVVFYHRVYADFYSGGPLTEPGFAPWVWLSRGDLRDLGSARVQGGLVRYVGAPAEDCHELFVHRPAPRRPRRRFSGDASAPNPSPVPGDAVRDPDAKGGE